MSEFSVYGYYRDNGYTVSKEGHRRILKNLLGCTQSAALEKRLSQADLLKLNAPSDGISIQEKLCALVKNLPSVDLYVKASLDHLVIAANPISPTAREVLKRYNNKADLILSRTFDDAMNNLQVSCDRHGTYLDSMIIHMIEEFILSDNRSSFYPIVASQHAESVIATNNATTFALEQDLIVNLFNRFAPYKELEKDIFSSFMGAIEEFKYDYAALTEVFYLVEKVYRLCPYLPLTDKIITFLSDTMFELSLAQLNKEQKEIVEGETVNANI